MFFECEGGVTASRGPYELLFADSEETFRSSRPGRVSVRVFGPAVLMGPAGSQVPRVQRGTLSPPPAPPPGLLLAEGLPGVAASHGAARPRKPNYACHKQQSRKGSFSCIVSRSGAAASESHGWASPPAARPRRIGAPAAECCSLFSRSGGAQAHCRATRRAHRPKSDSGAGRLLTAGQVALAPSGRAAGGGRARVRFHPRARPVYPRAGRSSRQK